MVEVDEERAARVRASIRAKAGEPIPTPVPPPAPKSLPQPDIAKPPHPQGGCFPTQHGLEAIQARGVHALKLNQVETMTGVEHELETREGIRDSLRRTAALGLVTVGILQDYLERKAAAGVDLGDVPIVRALPSFMNSVQRSLLALAAMTPKRGEHADEIKRVQDLLAASGAQQEGDSDA